MREHLFRMVKFSRRQRDASLLPGRQKINPEEHLQGCLGFGTADLLFVVPPGTVIFVNRIAFNEKFPVPGFVFPA